MQLKTKIFIVVFLFSFTLLLASSVYAVSFTPQVAIPGSNFKVGNATPMGSDTKQLGLYIKALYTYGISIVGIVATIMLMFGGFTWLTAGGSGEKVGRARDMIFGSLTGLVLALTSYTMLTMVNPDLVNFKIREVGSPIVKDKDSAGDAVNQEIVCCLYGSIRPSPTKTPPEQKNCTDISLFNCNKMKTMGNVINANSYIGQKCGTPIVTNIGTFKTCVNNDGGASGGW